MKSKLKDGDIGGDKYEDIQKERRQSQNDIRKEKGFDEFVFVIMAEKLKNDSR